MRDHSGFSRKLVGKVGMRETVTEGTNEKQEGHISVAKSKDQRVPDVIDMAGHKTVKGFTLTFDWLMGVLSLLGVLSRSGKIIV